MSSESLTNFYCGLQLFIILETLNEFLYRKNKINENNYNWITGYNIGFITALIACVIKTMF